MGPTKPTPPPPPAASCCCHTLSSLGIFFPQLKTEKKRWRSVENLRLVSDPTWASVMGALHTGHFISSELYNERRK